MKHGSYSTYTNHRCRCVPCRAANAAWHRNRRIERSSIEPPADSHGKAATYVNWTCRCEACTTAHVAANRERWLKRRAS